MGEPRAVDLSDWKPDKSYDECLRICEQLKLIETVQHGEHEYGRITQTGVNVMHTLMQLASYSVYPENALKRS